MRTKYNHQDSTMLAELTNSLYTSACDNSTSIGRYSLSKVLFVLFNIYYRLGDNWNNELDKFVEAFETDEGRNFLLNTFFYRLPFVTQKDWLPIQELTVANNTYTIVYSTPTEEEKDIMKFLSEASIPPVLGEQTFHVPSLGFPAPPTTAQILQWSFPFLFVKKNRAEFLEYRGFNYNVSSMSLEVLNELKSICNHCYLQDLAVHIINKRAESLIELERIRNFCDQQVLDFNDNTVLSKLEPPKNTLFGSMFYTFRQKYSSISGITNDIHDNYMNMCELPPAQDLWPLMCKHGRIPFHRWHDRLRDTANTQDKGLVWKENAFIEFELNNKQKEKRAILLDLIDHDSSSWYIANMLPLEDLKKYSKFRYSLSRQYKDLSSPFRKYFDDNIRPLFYRSAVAFSSCADTLNLPCRQQSEPPGRFLDWMCNSTTKKLLNKTPKNYSADKFTGLCLLPKKLPVEPLLSSSSWEKPDTTLLVRFATGHLIYMNKNLRIAQFSGNSSFQSFFGPLLARDGYNFTYTIIGSSVTGINSKTNLWTMVNDYQRGYILIVPDDVWDMLCPVWEAGILIQLQHNYGDHLPYMSIPSTNGYSTANICLGETLKQFYQKFPNSPAKLQESRTRGATNTDMTYRGINSFFIPIEYQNRLLTAILKCYKHPQVFNILPTMLLRNTGSLVTYSTNNISYWGIQTITQDKKNFIWNKPITTGLIPDQADIPHLTYKIIHSLTDIGLINNNYLLSDMYYQDEHLHLPPCNSRQWLAITWKSAYKDKYGLDLDTGRLLSRRESSDSQWFHSDLNSTPTYNVHDDRKLSDLPTKPEQPQPVTTELQPITEVSQQRARQTLREMLGLHQAQTEAQQQQQRPEQQAPRPLQAEGWTTYTTTARYIMVDPPTAQEVNERVR